MVADAHRLLMNMDYFLHLRNKSTNGKYDIYMRLYQWHTYLVKLGIGLNESF